MKEFMIGVIFISLLLPIFDGVSNIINQLVEWVCMCIAVKTAKKQASAFPQEEEVCTHAIGFQVPSGEEYDDDEEGDW